MSKIGKKPITIPDSVIVKAMDDFFECTGPLGSVRVRSLPEVSVHISAKAISLQSQSDTKQARANWGTFRSLLENAMSGVLRGFQKSLVIEGIGFRAAMEGSTLVLHVGYSHPIRFEPPPEVAVSVSKNEITVKGADRALVGQTAARIRALKKPEPYKGKGIRYSDEVIRRKAGKKLASAAK